MTKKHFILLADILRETRPIGKFQDDALSSHDYKLGALREWEQLRDALAAFCYSQNPRFNRERWIGYINGEVGPSGGRKSAK